jgi:hypothetical protein
MTNQEQRVKFTFPDGSEYDGSVTHTENAYMARVDDLPDGAATADVVIERLEARARTGDKYLFLKARYRDRSEEVPKNGDLTNTTSTTLLSPDTTFYADDPANPLSPNVNSLSVVIENLDVWFNKSVFDLDGLISDPNGSLYFVLEDIVGEYDFKGLRLTFKLTTDGLEYRRLAREMHLKQIPSIHLNVAEDADDVSYLELVKALRSIERLLGLAFRRSLRSVEIEVTSKDHSFIVGTWVMPVLLPYRINLSDVQPSAAQASYPEDLSFTFDQIGDFQALLDKWTELEDQIAPIVDLFLSSVSGASGVLENIFLNRIQGIEGFHRAFRGGHRENPTEYDARKERLLDGIHGDDRSFLRRVLKFGNDLSLADRLRAFDRELSTFGIPGITVCPGEAVASTRNYYSHYEVDITPVPSEQLPQLTHEAGQMLFALILIELGVDAEVVRRAVARTRLVNPF